MTRSSSRLQRGVSGVLRSLAIGLIRVYQVLLRPFFGGACRFHPSCSEYATEAFETLPPLRATWLTIRRLGRCHPFCRGGYDPVPVDGAEDRTKYDR